MVHSFPNATEARSFYASLTGRVSATMRLTQAHSLVFVPSSSAIGHASTVVAPERASRPIWATA